MTDIAEPIQTKKRFRSPAYPALDLAKAVERATSLMKSAHHHAVGVPVILRTWGMESDAGPVWRYLAALIQYGLVTDSGVGKARKFQVTDVGRRIIQDNDPNSQKRKEALKTAALSPTIHKELWEKFGPATNLSDTVLEAHLTLDRVEAGGAPYSQTAAAEVVQAYKATLVYAGLSDSDKVPTSDFDKNLTKAGDHSSDIASKVAIGDHVRWTSGGVDQFDARKVEWISPDRTFLRVFGSPAGIPMNEVTAFNPPGFSPSAPPAISSLQCEASAAAPTSAKSPNISVYQAGGRLQITADVDSAGIEKLESILAKYKEILKLMD